MLHKMLYALLVLCLHCQLVLSSHMDMLGWDPPAEMIGPRPKSIDAMNKAVSTTQRLTALRQEMLKDGIHAYVVPSEDEHLSEYVAPRYKRRQWISGFTGSAGTAVITATKAALWTDGRYFEQAENQLDSNWILMKDRVPGTPTIEEWIVQNIEISSTVAANPFVFAIGRWKHLDNYFSSHGVSFNQSIPDLIDNVWEDRPGAIGSEIIVFPFQYAGKDWRTKISEVRQRMNEENADYLLLTVLDEVAWTFNLRGDDIPYTPVFTSYALIGRQDLKLYMNTSQAQSDSIKNHLQQSDCDEDFTCVDILEYHSAREDILMLDQKSIVWMDPAGTTYGMHSAVEEEKQLQMESPIKVPKAVKNEIEREAMQRAHIYDAVALIEYIIWLEENVPKGNVDEVSGAEKLKTFRRNQVQNRGPSFKSISASGPNAAQIHYGTSAATNRNLTVQEIYLIDSGGQYFEGTTDVTRTLHFGEPTEFQREAYTRVLLGVIDIESAIFPSSLDGNDIGVLARKHLYDVGLDYRHGSGHGVGQYLTIHEYPPGIGTSGAEGYPLQVGMFTSVEPGYYQAGEFGIRHENMAMVKPAETKYDFGEYQYLTFEVVTLVPFQRKMIDVTLLSDFQLDYLNNYHWKIMETVGAEAQAQGKGHVYSWLQKETAMIERSSAEILCASLGLQYMLSIAITLIHLSSG